MAPAEPSPFADSERRASYRYPVSMELTYRLAGGDQGGAGRTLDMSSGGLCFSGSGPLAAGTVLELTLDWPILFEGVCPLSVVIRGSVLRSHAERTAIAITRYEFHKRRPMSTADDGASAKARRFA